MITSGTRYIWSYNIEDDIATVYDTSLLEFEAVNIIQPIGQTSSSLIAGDINSKKLGYMKVAENDLIRHPLLTKHSDTFTVKVASTAFTYTSANGFGGYYGEAAPTTGKYQYTVCFKLIPGTCIFTDSNNLMNTPV